MSVHLDCASMFIICNFAVVSYCIREHNTETLPKRHDKYALLLTFCSHLLGGGEQCHRLIFKLAFADQVIFGNFECFRSAICRPIQASVIGFEY